MNFFKCFFKFFLFLFLAAILTGAATLPLSAQVVIPEGATIDAAVFSIYWYGWYPTTFNLQRITQDWNEDTVTWNTFDPNYASGIIGTFTTSGGEGWYSADITGLVQQWMSGAYPNFGFVIRQVFPGFSLWNSFHSSEYGDTSLRPKLEIWYTTLGGETGYAIIQRPDPPETTVFDASITDFYPDNNYNNEILTCAIVSNGSFNEKYSLIRFHFDVVRGAEGCTPGYWKNHLEDWPTTGYSPGDYFNTVFGVSYFDYDYTLEDAINQGGGGIKKIARHGTAALLSASHPDVNYPYTPAEVISMVQAGNIDPLVDANELGCYIPEYR